MRKREEIQVDGTRKENLIIEVLLDIRDLLTEKPKVLPLGKVIIPETKRHRGRPKKEK